MSRFNVLASIFGVCISLLITTFAQQQQNLQQHPPPPLPQQQQRGQQQSTNFSPPPPPQQQQGQQKSTKSQPQPPPQQQQGQQQSTKSPPPPPPQQQQGQQQYTTFNKNNGNNQQQKQQNVSQNTKQTQQQPQVTQSNLQTPVNQNDRVPNRRVRPAIIAAAAAAAAFKHASEQKNELDLMKEFLHAHNGARRQYNQEPYIWDMNLEKFARQWGSKRSIDCKMVHSFGPYGENLFWGYQEHWTNSQAVQHWVEESQYYDSNQNSCAPQKVCGHFTQVVWKDTLRVGCARQKCNNGSLLVICEYDPPGNYVNEHPLKKKF